MILAAWFPTTSSTSGIFVKDQAEALAQYGDRVTVVVVNYFSLRNWITRTISGKRLHYLKPEGVKFIELNVIFLLPLRFFRNVPERMKNVVIRSARKKLARYTRKNGVPDLVHHHCLSDNAYITEAIATNWKIPYVFTEHSPYSSDEELNKFNSFETFADRKRFIANAKVRIAVSAYWAAVYEKIYGTSYVTIPNLVHPMFGNMLMKVPHEHFVFTCVALLDKQKNHEGLLKAFALVSRENRNVRLELIGDGPLSGRLRALAEQLQISGYVTFHGRCDRKGIMEILDRSDAFVLASFYETFGIAIVEAMFRGLPVVCTACGGPEEYIHSQNGILVKNKDEEALMKGMEQMVDAASSYDPVAISDSVKKLFSAESIVGRLHDMYLEVTRFVPGEKPVVTV